MGKWTDAAMEQRRVYDVAVSYLTDAEALTVKGVYWQWEDLVEAGTTVDKGYRFQYGVLYRCIRSSGQPLYHDLALLVGSYVEVVE